MHFLFEVVLYSQIFCVSKDSYGLVIMAAVFDQPFEFFTLTIST